MIYGALAVTLETGQAFANLIRSNSMGGDNGIIGGGNNGHEHDGVGALKTLKGDK